MLNIFTVVLRECLEAVLIVGLIVGFLSKENLLASGKKFVFAGVSVGVLLSFALGYGIYNMGDYLEGTAVSYFEAALFSVSALLIVHMVFWMRRMGKKMKSMLESDLSTSITRLGLWGVAMVAALSIAREGAETAVYLYSMSLSGTISISSLAIAGILGLVASLVIGIMFIKGLGLFNLTTFFNITSVFLLITAGSFVLQAVARLTEIGVLSPIETMVWDSSHWIPLDSGFGSFLNFFAGYTPYPSLIDIIVYAGYWGLVFVLYGMEKNPNLFKLFSLRTVALKRQDIS